MKNQRRLIFFVALVLVGGTAGALSWLKSNQKLGKPGLKAEPIPGSVIMKFDLPERSGDFTSTNVPESQVELDYFPKDTTYAHRFYQAPDGFYVSATVILMGADRTSIHKPDYCLPGQGWSIGEKSTVNIPVSGAGNQQLPVAKWVVANSYQTPDGQKTEIHGIYVFWFVADQEQTTDNYRRMWWLARDLLSTGVLQRWAYVSYFAVCAPGQEAATFGRMKDLIAGSVAQYQFFPGNGEVSRAVKN